MEKSMEIRKNQQWKEKTEHVTHNNQCYTQANNETMCINWQMVKKGLRKRTLTKLKVVPPPPCYLLCSSPLLAAKSSPSSLPFSPSFFPFSLFFFCSCLPQQASRIPSHLQPKSSAFTLRRRRRVDKASRKEEEKKENLWKSNPAPQLRRSTIIYFLLFNY